MSVYIVNPATMTKITAVMARTKNDTSRIANAGVETGAKMLGVSIDAINHPRARVVVQIVCRTGTLANASQIVRRRQDSSANRLAACQPIGSPTASPREEQIESEG